MRSSSRRAGLALAASLSLGAEASAEPLCAEGREPGTPIRVHHLPGELGVLPEACAATSAMLVLRASALVATEDFYGALHAGSALRARLALPGGAMLSALVPGPEYRFVANATVESESLELSAGSLGLHVPRAFGFRLSAAPYVRFLLPTETGFVRATRTGVEEGIAVAYRAARRVELDFGASAPFLVTTQGGPSLVRFSPGGSLDAVYRPGPAASLGAGLALRLAPGAEDLLDALDPRVALRLYPHGLLAVDLSAAFPLLGGDRTDAVLALHVGLVPRGAPSRPGR